MAAKRKFKRDYIILEAKDTNFRYKERVLPKAFAKVEVNEEKSVVALYVENLKYMKDGYRVVVIQSDYETVDLGKIVLSEQGKGEFVLDLVNDEVDIKGIAVLHDKTVPLIGFKGNKIENYEEILFTGDDEEYVEVEDDEEYEYEEIEYIEVEDGDEDDEYEEIEYIEVDDDEYEEYDNDDNNNDEEYEEYEEIEYIEIEDDDEEDEEINIQQEYIKPNPRRYTETKKQPQRQSKSQPQPQPQRQTQKQIQRQQRQASQQQYQPQYPKYNPTNQESSNRTPGALLMPRQIKKGLKYFREVKPFICDYIEDTRWWKIEVNPTTLCGYTMPYLGYVNTLNFTMYSDAIMNSYKYRHYLFGVQYDEYNKRKNYIYAVPGKTDEQPDRGQTGFGVYQPCDNRNDSLGYWLCFIDPRSRRIVK